jgi:hypothetical protein
MIRESIKKILKENTDLKTNLKKMMDQVGIYYAVQSVGGFDNFAKILNLNLDDPDSNFLMVKNFVEFSNRNPRIKKILDEDNIKIVDVEDKISNSGNYQINILFNTDDPAANIESWVISFYQHELENFFPIKFRKVYEPNFSIRKGEIVLNATKLKYDNLGNTLNEEDNKDFAVEKLKKMIDNIGIFKAAKSVGGIENLKKYFANDTDMLKIINSLKGKMNLIYHSNKEFIKFPVRFEIVGIGKNIWNSNSWPQVNLIYDDSYFDEDEKELFDQFIYHTIGDLNIGNVDIKPEARDMFKDGNYMAIYFVNGKNWESLDHDVEYFDKDMRHLYRKYMEVNHIPINENKQLTENEEDPTAKEILNFLLRRYKVEERNLGDEQHPIIFRTVFFDVNGETYVISVFQNKKEQIRVITDMLIIHNVIKPIDPYERQLDPYTQKVIRAIKTFLNQVFK